MELVFATNNVNKVKEIQQVIGDSFNLKGLKDIHCHEEVPENQSTLEGNALEKARYIYEKYHYNCFADDTGLEIEALENRPGVYSARYAGEEKDAEVNMNKVLDELSGSMNRNARFRTVIALIIDGREYLFEGSVSGKILTEKKGEKGFGYDPVFQPDGFNLSFAEMELEEKNTISHRAKAVQKLQQFLKKLPTD